MTRQVDENWKFSQQTTFTKWVNNALRGHLKVAKTQVNDLKTDLQDGLVLVELIDSIASPRKVGRYNKNPVIKPQLLENLSTVFRFLEREQIKVVNIGKVAIARCIHVRVDRELYRYLLGFIMFGECLPFFSAL